ncbi:toxin C-terminal domain-containing protein [Clostridium novyi]|uniref:toxin C-terminal domain-containing protein n=1 Tax=Clostridium novyi TaxID=1542 RepID=UPI000A8683CB|nr:toxin C-terminal domain-containing protein [Clostridium novyi]
MDSQFFKKGRKYITPDIDSHNGGVWKMADSIKKLGSRKTRMGTYDKHLNRIGD